MNLNRDCGWPSCSCKTEQGYPCRAENPDFYHKRATADLRADLTRVTKERDQLRRKLDLALYGMHKPRKVAR
ncbi:MAG: hypothetical protein AB7I34_19220 [Rhizobiaceae bacterium]